MMAVNHPVRKYSKARIGFRILVAIFLAGLLATACAPVSREGETVSRQQLVEPLGIEVQALRLTANGYMLDFRYRVLDSDKAQPLADRKVPMILIHEATGASFAVPSSPKIGPMRQTTRNTKPQVGKIYFVMFANPGGYVKAGDLATIVVGEQRIEHVPVE